jgi:hypothetical protein
MPHNASRAGVSVEHVVDSSALNFSQVPLILAHLREDKHIARAAHLISAWRCEVDGVMHQGATNQFNALQHAHGAMVR